MIISPGPLVSAASGSIGGLTFALAKNGRQVKLRALKPRRRSELEARRRARFQNLVALWQSQSVETRAAFSRSAQLVLFPNRLGIPRALSGFQLFMYLALSRPNSTVTIFSAPSLMLRSAGVAAPSLAASASGAITLSFTVNDPGGTSLVYSYGSRPVNSKPRAHFTSWRYLQANSCATGANNVTLTTLFDFHFGHPRQGEVIAVRFRSFNNGQLPGNWQIAQTTVTA